MKNVIKTLFVEDEALFYSLLLGGIAWVLVVLRSLDVINKGVDNLIFVGLFASGGAIPAIVGYFRGKRTWFAGIVLLMNLTLLLWLAVYFIAPLLLLRGIQ